MAAHQLALVRGSRLVQVLGIRRQEIADIVDAQFMFPGAVDHGDKNVAVIRCQPVLAALVQGATTSAPSGASRPRVFR
jgi:hypothetical protein